MLGYAYLFGSVPVENVSVAYDSSVNTFSGGGTLRLGAASYTLNVELGPKGFFGLLRKVSIDVSGLQEPLGYGSFLRRLGGSITKTGATPILESDATVSFGPELDLGPVSKGSVASIDGSAQLRFGNPMTLTFTGNGKIVDVNIAHASTSFSTNGYATLNGKLNLTLVGYGFSAGIDRAWFDYPTATFDVEAAGTLTLPGLAGRLLNGGADVVLSNRGLAACFGQKGARLGFAQAWGASIEPLGDSCDVGPFKQPDTHAARVASVDSSLTIPAGATMRVLALRGSQAPPAATLRGPGGVSLSTGPNGRLVQSRIGLSMQDPHADTTYLALLHSRPGKWRLRAPGASAVRVVAGLPPVRVGASVTRSHAGRYTPALARQRAERGATGAH